MLKKIVSSCVVIMALMLFSSTAFAATQRVSVSLPSFDVQLNNVKINNTHSQYPLIVYKGITYFPMTYYDCFFMGLNIKWSQENGLAIEKTGAVAEEYRCYESNNKNAKTYQAGIPTFKIVVGGKQVDNSKEEYPLLIFRNVTYFPLTWRFAVDEFNWSYHFDQDAGLTINSVDMPVQKLDLPYENKVTGGKLFNGYYYYTGEDKGEGNIYRVSLNDFSNASKVCKLGAGNDPYTYNPYISYYEKDNELYFSYHVGGATMGCDVYHKVNRDGVGEEVISGYLDFKNYKEGMIVVNYCVPPSRGGLYYIKSGQEERKRIGDSSYLYGWIRYINEGGYSPSNSLDIREDWVYEIVSKTDDKDDKTDINKLYKINFDTNEMLLVSDIPTKRFSIIDDKIYATSMDDKLYTMGLNGEQEHVLLDTAINDYIIDGDQLYYVAKESGELFCQKNDGTVQCLMQERKVAHIQKANDYFVCILENNGEAYGEAYGLVVLDKEGNQIFKTLDKVRTATAEGDYLIYKMEKSQQSYVVRLKL
ncbi:MAG: DUF5050 domain-containing protein [Clostridia bacterium]|nr:DUF5050 domain-containing protein [Clostridia bacterium]